MTISYVMLQDMGICKTGIALNAYQLRLLGIGCPPKQGWVSGLLGKYISDDAFSLIMELKGPRKKRERKEILARHGISAGPLFQARLL